MLDDGLYFADGQILDEVYVYGSFRQSRMYEARVTCTDCHNPHSGELVTGSEPDAVCAQCHAPAVFDVTDHTGHAAGSVGCVDCHMAERTYMVVDDRRDHGFRVPRPDLTAKVGTPNACNGCHTDRDAAWASTATTEWHGTSSRPEFATRFAAARDGHANAGMTRLAKRATEYPAIVRATALSMMRSPVSLSDLDALKAGLDDPDPLVRIGALQGLRNLPPELRLDAGAASLLTDPVRGVRLEAVNTVAGMADLLPVELARAYGTAADEYRHSLKTTASRPESNSHLAEFELANGDWRTAKVRYERALSIDAAYSPARANLADLHRQLGDEGTARRVLRDGLDINPDDAALRHALGLALVRSGDYDEAVEQIRTAARLEPGNARYVYVLGVALQSTGNTVDAIAVLRQANADFPGDRDILIALATMLRDSGDIEGASAVVDEFAERFPADINVGALRRSLREDR